MEKIIISVFAALCIYMYMAYFLVRNDAGKTTRSDAGKTRNDAGNTKTKQPHILFIVADDYGWNDVGYHGSEINTPNIDRLAAQGVKLENYYVQPICTPSRSVLMSGMYQIHTGLQHLIIQPCQPSGLPLKNPTIADMLKQEGYSTHAVGKWHLGFYKKEYTPTYRGFDTFYGMYLGSGDHFTHEAGNKRRHGVDLHDNEDMVWNNTEYSTTLYTRKVEDIVANHDSDKPLFIYLAYQAVHIGTSGGLQVPYSYTIPYSRIREKERRKFAGMVSCMDEGIGNVTRALQKKGFWEDTVLVFSTDNGGSVAGGSRNWPLRGTKGTVWEGGMRGVGFVHSALVEQKRTVNTDLFHISDWFPTLVHLAGGSTSGLNLDGYNIWPSISWGQPSERTELLHSIDPLMNNTGRRLDQGGFDNTVSAAVRVGRWKLITGNPGHQTPDWVPPPGVGLDVITKKESPDKNLWLFNIAEDPYEKTDLSELRMDVVHTLLDRLSYHNSTAIPVFYPKTDKRCEPSLHGGAWLPWDFTSPS